MYVPVTEQTACGFCFSPSQDIELCWTFLHLDHSGFYCICVEFGIKFCSLIVVDCCFQKVEEMQISDMLKDKDIMENVKAFQVVLQYKSYPYMKTLTIMQFKNYLRFSVSPCSLFSVLQILLLLCS